MSTLSQLNKEDIEDCDYDYDPDLIEDDDSNLIEKIEVINEQKSDYDCDFEDFLNL